MVLLCSIINSIDIEVEVSFLRFCEVYLSKFNSNVEYCLIVCVEKVIKGVIGCYFVISIFGGIFDGCFFVSEYI